MATLSYFDGTEWQSVTGITFYAAGGGSTSTWPYLDLHFELVQPEVI